MTSAGGSSDGPRSELRPGFALYFLLPLMLGLLGWCSSLAFTASSAEEEQAPAEPVCVVGSTAPPCP